MQGSQIVQPSRKIFRIQQEQKILCVLHPADVPAAYPGHLSLGQLGQISIPYGHAYIAVFVPQGLILFLQLRVRYIIQGPHRLPRLLGQGEYPF